MMVYFRFSHESTLDAIKSGLVNLGEFYDLKAIKKQIENDYFYFENVTHVDLIDRDDCALLTRIPLEFKVYEDLSPEHQNNIR